MAASLSAAKDPSAIFACRLYVHPEQKGGTLAALGGDPWSPPVTIVITDLAELPADT
jgi:hypothetical protein